jgi:1,4-dihydroxy-6-naphthoate synthase
VSLRFGFSPCPNDTFAFWAAVHGRVPGPKLAPVLGDIETLNVRAVSGPDPLEVTKLSVPALCTATRYKLLPSGAALGYGCGPLVVVADRPGAPRTLAELRSRRVAIPGRQTTAFLLFGLFGPDCEFAAMPFGQIMPAVARGDCDAGLVIHEGRFTFRDHGLAMVADLGELWERDTALPLPLGVIAARTDLGSAQHEAIAAVLRSSVELARGSPALPRPWVRQHAQELDDAVCDRHIALYVNDFSVELGPLGHRALDVLISRGRQRGLLPRGVP